MIARVSGFAATACIDGRREAAVGGVHDVIVEPRGASNHEPSPSGQEVLAAEIAQGRVWSVPVAARLPCVDAGSSLGHEPLTAINNEFRVCC